MKIRNLVFIWMTVFITGCASMAPSNDVITPPEQCEAEGGCVVVGRLRVLGLLRQAYTEGATQSCRRSGA